MTGTVKTVLIVGGVGAAGVAAYFFWRKRNSPVTSATVNNAPPISPAWMAIQGALNNPAMFKPVGGANSAPTMPSQGTGGGGFNIGDAVTGLGAVAAPLFTIANQEILSNLF